MWKFYSKLAKKDGRETENLKNLEIFQEENEECN